MRIQCRVYCDDAKRPIADVAVVEKMRDVDDMLRSLVGRRVYHTCIWNYQAEEYVLLDSFAQVIEVALSAPARQLFRKRSNSTCSTSRSPGERVQHRRRSTSSTLDGNQRDSKRRASSSRHQRSSSVRSTPQDDSRGGDGGDLIDVPLVQFWVESQPYRFEEVDSVRDAAEYAQLSQHVSQWIGNEKVGFELVRAYRLTFRILARLFERKSCSLRLLGDPELLCYANNSISGEEVLEHGFVRSTSDRSLHPTYTEKMLEMARRSSSAGREDCVIAGDGEPSENTGDYTFASSGSMSLRAVHRPFGAVERFGSSWISFYNGPLSERKDQVAGSSNKQCSDSGFVFSSSVVRENSGSASDYETPQRVLLCEVAVGKPYDAIFPLTSHVVDLPDGYDSVVHEVRFLSSAGAGENKKSPRSKKVRSTSSRRSSLSGAGDYYARSRRSSIASSSGNGGNSSFEEREDDVDDDSVLVRKSVFIQDDHRALPRYLLVVRGRTAGASAAANGHAQNESKSALSKLHHVKDFLGNKQDAHHSSAASPPLTKQAITQKLRQMGAGAKMESLSSQGGQPRRDGGGGGSGTAAALSAMTATITTPPRMRRQLDPRNSTSPPSVARTENAYSQSRGGYSTRLHELQPPSGLDSSALRRRGSSIPQQQQQQQQLAPRRVVQVQSPSQSDRYQQQQQQQPQQQYQQRMPQKVAVQPAPNLSKSAPLRQLQIPLGTGTGNGNTGIETTPHRSYHRDFIPSSLNDTIGTAKTDVSSLTQRSRSQAAAHSAVPVAHSIPTASLNRSSGAASASSAAVNSQRIRPLDQRFASPIRAASREGSTMMSRVNSSYSPPQRQQQQQQRRASSVPQTDVYCLAHPQELLDLWCFTCDTLACPYCCSVGVHKGHNVHPATTVATQVLEQAHELQRVASGKLEVCRRLQDQMRGIQSEVNQRQSILEESIRVSFTDLHTLLSRKENELLEYVVDQQQINYEASLAELDVWREEYRDALSPLVSMLDQTTRNAHVWSGYGQGRADIVEFLRGVPPMVSRLDNFISSRDAFEMDSVKKISESLSSQGNTLHLSDLAGIRQFILDIQVRNALTRRPSNAPSSAPQRAGSFVPPNAADNQRSTPLRNRSADTLTSASPGPRYPAPDAQPLVGILRTNSTDSVHGRDQRIGRSSSNLAGDSSSVRSNFTPQNGGVPLNVMANQRRFSDLRRGHIWVIPNASDLFNPSQRKSVCSGPFKMDGLTWELRIHAPPSQNRQQQQQQHVQQKGNPGNRPTAARPGVTVGGDVATTGEDNVVNATDQEHVGVFLYAIGHTLRVDFRVIVFSASSWHEEPATSWSEAFAGKGWGVFPFVTRRQLISRESFAPDNQVKLCVVSTSATY